MLYRSHSLAHSALKGQRNALLGYDFALLTPNESEDVWFSDLMKSNISSSRQSTLPASLYG
jgi:hypothetical protein